LQQQQQWMQCCLINEKGVILDEERRVHGA
jgi:hypothetical protein